MMGKSEVLKSLKDERQWCWWGRHNFTATFFYCYPPSPLPLICNEIASPTWILIASNRSCLAQIQTPKSYNTRNLCFQQLLRPTIRNRLGWSQCSINFIDFALSTDHHCSFAAKSSVSFLQLTGRSISPIFGFSVPLLTDSLAMSTHTCMALPWLPPRILEPDQSSIGTSFPLVLCLS